MRNNCRTNFPLTKALWKIFFLLLWSGGFFSIPEAYACDPLGCLMIGGHEQDALILGDVIAETGDSKSVEVTFIFPQTTDKDLEKGEVLKISDPDEQILLGKSYLMSVQRNRDSFTPRWGIFEITGTGYAVTELVQRDSIEDEALQIFINSGGTERDFAFDYSGPVPVLLRHTGEGETVKYFDYLHPTAQGVLLAVSGVFLLMILAGVLVFWKRKHY